MNSATMMTEYALPELPGDPVKMEVNPDLDAPQRHRYVRPAIELPVRVMNYKHKWRGDSLIARLRPHYKAGTVVTFLGGPRCWWDRDEGILNPTVPLADLERFSDQVSRGGYAAGEIDEVYGNKLLGLAVVNFKGKRLIVMQSKMFRSPAGTVTWADPANAMDYHGLALCSPDALRALVTAAQDVRAEAVTAQIPYGPLTD